MTFPSFADFCKNFALFGKILEATSKNYPKTTIYK